MTKTTEKVEFQAEVGRLLDIVTHAIYSDREVFLRELCSNAADACDKLRYAAVTKPELLSDDPYLSIRLVADEEAGTLSVIDNGIGMTRDDMVANLGTIARSGSKAFMDDLADASKAKKDDGSIDVSLIGQFGIGFYAAFMVASKVEVFSTFAGEKKCYCWESDGQSGFTISEVEGDDAVARGTKIVLHLKDDAKEFLAEDRIKYIIGKYSDHVGVPIHLGTDLESEPINKASALWLRKDVSDEEYDNFYRHVSHAPDKPLDIMHWHAEGMMEYTGLLFIPETRPFDLFDPKRAHGVKLYVRKVFITENCEGLVPPYLRFLRGVIDSSDLPLNVSREMLQNNPMVSKLRSQITKRVMNELTKLSDKEPEKFEKFWENYGAVLKEGLYDEHLHRDELMAVVRFQSSHEKGWVSLADYVSRMKEGQDKIYYITGEDHVSLRNSPHLEAYAAKGIEVLLLTDSVDQLWVTSMPEFEGKRFVSATQGQADLSDIKSDDGKDDDKKEDKKPEKTSEEVGVLIGLFESILAGQVKNVRASGRLTTSPCILVADDGDLDIQLSRMLKQQGRLDIDQLRILEINPNHPLIVKLAEEAKGLEADSEPTENLENAANILLDQARILDGEPLPNPAGFAKRLSELMLKVV